MRYLLIIFLILPVIFNGVAFGNTNFTVRLDCSHIIYPNDTEKAIAIMRYCTDAEKEVP